MNELNLYTSNIKLHNKDCLKILKDIPDNSVNCVISDAPYGIKFNNKYYNKNETDWDTFKTSKEFIDFTEKWLNEVYRVLTPTGTCWMFFGPTRIHEMFEAIKRTQFTNHLENWSIYARETGRGTTKKLKSLREDIFHLTKDSKQYTWNAVEFIRKVIAPYKNKGGEKRGWDYFPGTDIPMRFTSLGNIMAFSSECQFGETDAKKGTVCDIASGLPLKFDGYPADVTFFVNPSYNNKFDRQQHSCQKPILLLSMLTMISSLEGETILDPFMGSGSSAVASVICNRNFIGIEKEKDTYNKSIEWIKNFPYETAEKYIKGHISSNEEGFKFGFKNRSICKK